MNTFLIRGRRPEIKSLQEWRHFIEEPNSSSLSVLFFSPDIVYDKPFYTRTTTHIYITTTNNNQKGMYCIYTTHDTATFSVLRLAANNWLCVFLFFPPQKKLSKKVPFCVFLHAPKRTADAAGSKKCTDGAPGILLWKFDVDEKKAGCDSDRNTARFLDL